MIPLRDENPTRTFPVVTVIIISLNILIFALGKGSEAQIYKYALVPSHLTNPSYADFHDGFNPFLSIFTAMFIHAGYMHLGGNMLYLWIFGNNIEDSMGPVRFIFFYLISGTLATLSHVAFTSTPKVPVVGASGAISGVLGGYLLLFPKARVLTLIFIGFFIRVVTIPAFFLLIFWFIVQLVSGTISLGAPHQGGVAWFAHIGGFVSGLLLIKRFRKHEQTSE